MALAPVVADVAPDKPQTLLVPLELDVMACEVKLTLLMPEVAAAKANPVPATLEVICTSPPLAEAVTFFKAPWFTLVLMALASAVAALALMMDAELLIEAAVPMALVAVAEILVPLITVLVL